MAYRDLRDFIDQLERDGELGRVRAEVDPKLEMTAFCDRDLVSIQIWPSITAYHMAIRWGRPSAPMVPMVQVRLLSLSWSRHPVRSLRQKPHFPPGHPVPGMSRPWPVKSRTCQGQGPSGSAPEPGT